MRAAVVRLPDTFKRGRKWLGVQHSFFPGDRGGGARVAYAIVVFCETLHDALKNVKFSCKTITRM